MAEPIILAYGRGSIPEFPGILEGIIDIIPADFVVNAILAAAANSPDDDAGVLPRVLRRRNLQFKGLYEHVEGVLRARARCRSLGAAT